MPAPKRANDLNTLPCWKVRIYVRGCGIIHLLCETEPKVIVENGVLQDVQMKCISNTEHGDTVGFIDWREVTAATWRFAPLATE